ncbi:MAG: peptide-methionine (S)-S-oxide reductase MsrA [bacterium]|nr:peptide-methionine (S)-S-oxide reductase MsrA [bacterium]
MERALFAAGCFWHVEETFRTTKGVIDTTSGYTGGTTKDPAYKEVCSGKTGHAETVEVVFDPEQISYEQLLDLFWKLHDPTTLNRQGPDRGTQYRSAVFYVSPEQKAAAEASRKRIENSGKYKRPVVTEITAASHFYPAEDYHQEYLKKRGLAHCPS